MPLFTQELEFSDDYPTIEPSLKLDFANARALDPRITFTRASTATYVGRDGLIKYAGEDEARFDHDPTTGESLGLLIEESRTNIIPYSTTYFGWSTYSSAIPSTTQETLAPDGTYTAIKIISTGTQSQFGFYEALSYSANTVYTHSMWLKAGTATRVGLSISSGTKWTTSPYLIVDLDTGTVNATGSSISTKLTAYPNGWYLLEATGEFGGTSQTDGIWSYTATPGGHSGDTTSYYYQWGGQVEAGAFATSYIPTSGSTVTRAADIAKITGTNFTDFYNASESTIFFESGIAPTNNSKYFTFYGSDGGGTELIESSAVSGPGANIFTYADSTVYSNTSVTDASATKLKFAAGIKLNDVNLAVNGILGTTDNSATNPDAINQLIIGNYSSGSYYLNTSIRKLSYYNKRLPNAQLQGLTAQ